MQGVAEVQDEVAGGGVRGGGLDAHDAVEQWVGRYEPAARVSEPELQNLGGTFFLNVRDWPSESKRGVLFSVEMLRYRYTPCQ